MFFKKRKSKKNTNAPVNWEQQFPDASDEQLRILETVTPHTMTSPERILALCNAVDYVVKNQIPGSFVECGVWRGGSMAAVARALMNWEDQQRELWLYDTFEGMSKPGESDVDLRGESADQLMSQQDPADPNSVWCRAGLETVQSVMKSTAYPDQNINYVQGKVEDTLPIRQPEQIALLRLDTDWYESTRVELEQLFPKLSPGGVLIVDDYGHWQGCRRAVDEYFAENNIRMLLNRIDYTGRIGVYVPVQELSHVA